MATTSSVCVAATCRWRTASRARRSAVSTKRVATIAEHAGRADQTSTRATIAEPVVKGRTAR